MAKYAYEKGCKRIVILYADDDYGRGLANAFEDQAMDKGITIVDRRSYFGDTKEFKKLLNKWTILNYDAIFIADVMPRGAELIVQARAAGAEVPIMGGDGLDTARLWEIGGKSTENTVVASVFNPHDPSPEVQQFIADYQTKYGVAPDRGAARGYDAVKLLVYAINQAGSTVPDQIAQVLHATKLWPGATGLHTFDENGEIWDKAVGKKIMRNGQFEYLPIQ
jgi:branched-chain amino acid transport system substrate-binding protein